MIAKIETKYIEFLHMKLQYVLPLTYFGKNYFASRLRLASLGSGIDLHFFTEFTHWSSGWFSDVFQGHVTITTTSQGLGLVCCLVLQWRMRSSYSHASWGRSYHIPKLIIKTPLPFFSYVVEFLLYQCTLYD